MKKKILDKLINFIIKNKECSKRDIIIYKYGLECIYNLIFKTLVLLMVAFTLKITKEYLLLILFYTPLRLYAFGIHAESSLGCWISSTLIYIIIPTLIKFTTIDYPLLIISWIICAISFIIWAPADTKKRPIITASRRNKLKIKSIIVIFLYFIFILSFKNSKLLNTIFFCQILETLCILPITYKIFKMPYRNYLNYHKKGLNN